MKNLLIYTTTLLMISISAFAQVEYRATQVQTGKYDFNQQKFIKGSFKPVATKTIITLYNNALTVRGDRDINLKFVRKINVVNGDGNLEPQWKAVTFSDEECTVMLKDYGTYSRIGIVWSKSNTILVYQTM